MKNVFLILICVFLISCNNKFHKMKVYVSKTNSDNWIIHKNYENRHVVYNHIIYDTSVFSVKRYLTHKDSLHRFQNYRTIHDRVFFKAFYTGLVVDNFVNGKYIIKVNCLVENVRDTLKRKNIVYTFKYHSLKETKKYTIITLQSTRMVKHTGHFRRRKRY